MVTIAPEKDDQELVEFAIDNYNMFIQAIDFTKTMPMGDIQKVSYCIEALTMQTKAPKEEIVATLLTGAILSYIHANR